MTERTIGDRYELESKIGSGGMGTVWRAKDRILNRFVAVKLLHDGLAHDSSFAERFRREARAAASLTHANVATVYDTGEEDGIPYIVMEYVDGESLHRMIQRQGPFPVEDAARVARSVLGALAHAHGKGLVHRDVKPANVLFDSATGTAKVVDFGIAKGLEDTGGLTRSGLIGTAAYLSPEQVNGGNATPASDLYGVGCLLYCCLAGDPPFNGSTAIAIAMRHLNDPIPSIRRRRPDIPAPFEAVITRALAKDPAHRFASADEMDATIAATGLDTREATTPTVVEVPASTVAMRDHPVGAAPGRTESFTRERTTSRSGNPRWLPAVTAFLVIAAIAAVFVLYMQSREVPLVEVTPQPTVPVFVPPTDAPTPSASPTADPDDDDDESPFAPLDLPVIGD
ncbi:MAG: protein kinase [Actinomycetota bacterium]